MRSTRLRFALLLTLLPGLAHAVEPRTEHTFQLSTNEAAPTAGPEVAAWLAGSWVGNAFGMTFEEVWNPPSANSMVGMFKLMNGDAVQFYELMILAMDEGRLSLKVKHFSDAFVAWEDKPDAVNFRLVAVEDNAIHFSGISFYRIDDDHIEGYIVMKTKDGVKEEKLEYRRVKNPAR
jgi:hypothetical protein